MGDIITLKDQLKGEYRESYEKVELYASTKNIRYDEAGEEMLMDLLDLLLTAQQDGKPVEQIVGMDLEKFCKEYFSGYGMEERIHSAITDTYKTIRFVFIFEVIDLLFQIGDIDSVWHATSDVSGYLLGILIGGVIRLMDAIVIRPFIFRMKKVRTGVYDVCLFVFVILAIILSVFYIEMEEIAIPTFPMVLVTGLFVLIHFVAVCVKRYQTTGSVKKVKDPVKEAAKKEEKEEYRRSLNQSFMTGTRQRFERINKKRKRKGKEEMTPAEYTEYIRKEMRTSKRMGKVTDVIIAIIFALPVITNIGQGTVEDNVFYAIAMLLGYGVYLLVSKKLLNGSFVDDIMAECDAHQVEFLQYGEWEKSEEEESVED